MARWDPDRIAGGELLRWWAPVFVWMGCILVASGDSFSSGRTARILLSVLSVVPAAYFDTIHLIVRKTAHLVEYGLLGFLAYRAFQCTWPTMATDRSWLGSVLIVLACAMADEGRQSLLVSRTGSLSDVLLDTLGACIGILLFRALTARRQNAWSPAPQADA